MAINTPDGYLAFWNVTTLMSHGSDKGAFYLFSPMINRLLTLFVNSMAGETSDLSGSALLRSSNELGLGGPLLINF